MREFKTFCLGSVFNRISCTCMLTAAWYSAWLILEKKCCLLQHWDGTHDVEYHSRHGSNVRCFYVCVGPRRSISRTVQTKTPKRDVIKHGKKETIEKHRHAHNYRWNVFGIANVKIISPNIVYVVHCKVINTRVLVMVIPHGNWRGSSLILTEFSAV